MGWGQWCKVESGPHILIIVVVFWHHLLLSWFVFSWFCVVKGKGGRREQWCKVGSGPRHPGIVHKTRHQSRTSLWPLNISPLSFETSFYVLLGSGVFLRQTTLPVLLCNLNLGWAIRSPITFMFNCWDWGCLVTILPKSSNYLGLWYDPFISNFTSEVHATKKLQLIILKDGLFVHLNLKQ